MSIQSSSLARRRGGFVLREGFRQIISLLLVWATAMATLPSYAVAEKPLTVWHPVAPQPWQASLPASVEPQPAMANRTAARRTRIKSSPAIDSQASAILLAQAQSMNAGGGLSAGVFPVPRPGTARLSPEQVTELGDKFYRPEKGESSSTGNRVLMARAEAMIPPLAAPAAASSSGKLSPSPSPNNLTPEFALMPSNKAVPVSPAMVMVQSPPQIAGLAVFVGYADNLRANSNFPVPWQGSPNTTFIGQGPTFDAGAIRLDNNTDTPIHIDSVFVTVPGWTVSAARDAQGNGIADLWGSFTIQPNSTVILTQTNAATENFDTSDFGVRGCGDTLANGQSPIPTVRITINGIATTFSDTGHVLDTGGFDLACRGNESLQWRLIGTTGIESGSSHITLAPPTSVQQVGATYTATAQVTDASNQPTPNVVVDFIVLSGPNAGKTGKGTTDSQGNATFSYSSVLAGTDILRASVTNAAGGVIQSEQVTTTWTSADPCPAPTGPPDPTHTTIVNAGPSAGEYSDPLTLAAQLTDGNGAPLANRSLTFIFGSQSFHATTDNNGVATINIPSAPAPGTVPLNVSFAGETGFNPAQLSSSINIDREETSIRYTGGRLLGTVVPQPVSAVLTDPLGGTPIANETVTFRVGTVQAQAVTNAQGIAATTLTLGADQTTGPMAIQVSFAGDSLYKPSLGGAPVTVYLSTSFVVWGGNPGGVRLGQDVNFWGAQWANQVTSGNFTANPSFKGFADPVNQVHVCEAGAGNGGPLDDQCWSSKPGNSFPPPLTVPAYIEVIISNAISKQGSEIFGNIAAAAVCKVDPTPVYGPDPGKPGFCTLVDVVEDGAGLFPQPPALTATQTQPATVLPGQNFNVTAQITNTSSAQAGNVTVNESFDGLTPSTGTQTFASILNGAQKTATFQVTSPAIPIRQSNETSLAYQQRLAAVDGHVFTSTGTINFTDTFGQQFLPIEVSSFSRLQIPELIVGISGSPCVGPGSRIAYKVTVGNIGTATAQNVLVTLSFPDGSNASSTIASIPAGGSVTSTINFVVPAISAKQPGESDQQYLARLAAIDGSTLVTTAKVDWQDALGNSYGEIEQKIISTVERVPILTVTPQGPASLLPAQTAALNFTVQNTGGGNSFQVLLQVTNPDGSVVNIPAFALQGGQANTVSSTFTLAGAAKRSGESDAAYQARLTALDNSTLNFPLKLIWQDAAGNSYGPVTPQFQTLEVLPVLSITLAGAPSLIPGENNNYGLTVTNIGHAEAATFNVSVQLPDGSGVNPFPASIFPVGAKAQISLPFNIPRTQPEGQVTATATLNWTDHANNAYGPETPTVVSSVSRPNLPPVVSAGPNQTISLPANSFVLNGTVTDDGKPQGVALAIQWTQVSGPAPVTFNSPNQPVTQAGFSTTGVYVLQLSASDTQFTTTAKVTITVLAAAANKPPVVSAGPNQTLTLPTNTVTLNGTATDDGLPNGTLLTSWSVVSGPAPVIFGSPAQPITSATFTTAGVYVLRLTASDTQLSSSADVTVTVNAELVGNIEVCYFCNVDFGLGKFLDGPEFVIRNTTSTPMTGGILRIGPAGGFSDSFNVGTIPAGGFVPVVPGLSKDGSTAHTFFAFIGGPLDTSDFTPASNDTQFEFTAVQTPFTVDSSVFTPAATQGVSLDNTVSNINFLGGPGNNDGPCLNCFDKIVANLSILTMPVLTIAKTHTGNFTPGQQNAAYTITVSNFANATPTSGTVTVTDTLPAGLTLVSMAGTGWSCAANSCSRSDALAVGASYPPITVTVNVSINAASPQINTATVAGGGFTSSTTVDATIITGGTPSITQITPNTAQQGQQNLSIVITGRSTHFVSGTTTVQFGSGITVVSVAVNSPTSATAVVNIDPGAPLSARDITVTTGAEIVTLAGGFSISGGISVMQGWIGQPVAGAVVQGQVPITVASGITLTSGVLDFWPVSNPSNVQVLNANTTGSGTIGTFDGTLLQNGTYIVRLTAADSTGHVQTNLSLITVNGDLKPGRITTEVTDLIVPAKGLPISIKRRYDSLNSGRSLDFGFGWSLDTTVDVEISPTHDVTLTLAGQRRTFNFTPQIPSPFFAFIATPAYTAEPGFFGKLEETGDNCGGAFFISQGVFICPFSTDIYQPTGFRYTDPTGTKYTMAADGTLQSIQDINGNTLTITANGISSTIGLNVPFARDSLGRITQITDTLGNLYQYAYDGSGNLSSVTYPALTAPTSYTYDSTHRLTGGTDPNNNPLPSKIYDASGRLQSVTDALGNTTSYAYSTSNINGVITSTTTMTYPPDANGKVGTTTMVYDSYGKLLSSTDPLGHVVTNTYDASHNLASTTDALKHTITYSYDAHGNQTSVTYPRTATSINTTSTTTYNQFSQPTSHIDQLGNVRNVAYDANLLPQIITDTVNGSPAVVESFHFNADGTKQADAPGFDLSAVPGKATTYTYDANGSLASETDPLGRVTSYNYDNLGLLRSVTRPLPAPTGGLALAAPVSNTTTYLYDDFGRLLEIDEPLGRVTKYTYDNNGNRTSETDPNGNTTTFKYDALNRLTLTTFPTRPATTESRTYDFHDNLIDLTDQAGHVTHHVYDLEGRLISVTTASGTPDAATSSYTYYDDGRQKSATDPLNHTTTYTYDEAGRLTIITDALGHQTVNAYDDADRLISTTDPNHHTTKYSYDSRGRQHVVTYPDATTTVQDYDSANNLIGVTDQALAKIQYTYDNANQLLSAVQANHPDPAHNSTTYTYDNLGDLTTVTDANGHSTRKTFDLLGELTSETFPAGGSSEIRSFDATGNLLTRQDFNGKTSTYSYDQLNQLIGIAPDPSLGQTAVNFTYTPNGQIASMTDAGGVINYTYDNQDRVKTKSTPAGTLTYTYDAAGNVASMSSSNPNGVSVSYTYDQLNRLSTVIDNRLPVGKNITVYAYDPASNLATVTYPNGVQSTLTYDSLDRLKSLQSAIGTSAAIATFGYQLAPIGNKTALTELSGRSVQWNYDGIYRLTGETVGHDPNAKNGTVGYGFDPVGNRTSITSSLFNISSGVFTFSANDFLATEGYDNNGNVTAEGGIVFAYDFRDRLVKATNVANNGQVLLAYDALGNRISKTAAGITTQYLIDEQNPTGLPQVVEEVVNGIAQKTYSYGYTLISQNQMISGAPATSFYGYDGSGNVRFLTNAAGAVTDTYDYDAFGNLINSSGATPNNYLYSGEQFDSDLRLYYLRARYYNPVTGRFLSRDANPGDTTTPEDFHKYSYAWNNPVNLADPTGFEAEEEAELTTISTRSAPAIFQVGMRIACILNGLADALDVINQFQSGNYLQAGVALVYLGVDLNSCRAVFRTAGVKPGPPKPKIKDVYIDPKKYPEAARHAEDAIKSGKPNVLTVDRPGAPGRRADALRGKPTRPGTDRDEYPPAFTREGGANSSVRNIPPGDNRGAGSSIGHQTRDVPNGGQIRINIGTPPPR